MKVLFEDFENDMISQLFQYAYSDEIKAMFMYSNGNGNLAKKLRNIPRDEEVYVFIDMNPWNEHTIHEYKRIKNVIDKTHHNTLIFPIVGAEFYVLQSVRGVSYYMKDIDVYDEFMSDWREALHLRHGCNTYEQYLKRILNRHMNRLLCTDKKGYIDGMYYKQDDDVYTLLQKSLLLRLQYPTYPMDGGVGGTRQELYALHVKLVSEFNKWRISAGFSGDDVTPVSENYLYL